MREHGLGFFRLDYSTAMIDLACDHISSRQSVFEVSYLVV